MLERRNTKTQSDNECVYLVIARLPHSLGKVTVHQRLVDKDGLIYSLRKKNVLLQKDIFTFLNILVYHTMLLFSYLKVSLASVQQDFIE